MVVFWVLAAGCGGPGRFEGTVGGHALEVRDAVFFPLEGAPDGTAVRLVLGDREGLCEALASSREAPAASSAVLTLFRLDDAGEAQALVVGPYQGALIVPGGGAFAMGSFRRTDETCEQLLEPGAAAVTGGQVTLERLVPGPEGRLAGTFELSFGPQGERARGAFDARACPITALPASPVCL